MRARVVAVRGPIPRGATHGHYDFEFELEFDPGTPYEVERGIACVRFSDMDLLRLRIHPPADPKNAESGTKLAYRVLQRQLSDRFGASGAPRKQTITVEESELADLARVDPSRVSIDTEKWTILGAETGTSSGRVFISCGQTTAEEVAIGAEIARRVHEATGHTGYFAQNQTTLEGLTRNIFEALHSSVGFIAVMHRRDLLPTRQPQQHRGSVWVEQEIAIASFIVQVLNLPLPAKAYVQRGILREGVRGFIQLNPNEFETADDILADLESWLPSLSLPGVGGAKPTSLPLADELALIEAAKRHYKMHGEVRSLLAPLAAIPVHEKRRLHQVIMNVVKREHGRQPRAYSREELEELYPS